MAIQKLRTLTGLSQVKFCEKYHIPLNTFVKWERDKREPPDYLVELLEFKVEKAKKYITNRKEDLPSFDMRKNICWAVRQLSNECEIELYSDGKATESDFDTEEINWSEFEERAPEEILGI